MEQIEIIMINGAYASQHLLLRSKCSVFVSPAVSRGDTKGSPAQMSVCLTIKLFPSRFYFEITPVQLEIEMKVLKVSLMQPLRHYLLFGEKKK